MPAPPPLWSDEFLAQEVREQPEYEAIERDSKDFDAFLAAARSALASMQGVHEPDERTTIDRVIKPLLTALGWPATLEALSLTSRDEVDVAIFSEAAAAEHLLTRPERDQVLGATGIVECKRWDRDFDAAGTGAPAPNRRGESAAQQVQRYLLTAGTDSNESVRWAILTNGARWRLYSYRARPRERTWQIDLNALLVSADLFESVLSEQKLHELRVAWLLLRRDSWVPAEGERETLPRPPARARPPQRRAARQRPLRRHLQPRLPGDRHTLLEQTPRRLRRRRRPRRAHIPLPPALHLLRRRPQHVRIPMICTTSPHSLRYSVRDPVHRAVRPGGVSRQLSTNFWQRAARPLRAIIDQGDASDRPTRVQRGTVRLRVYAILDEITSSPTPNSRRSFTELSHTRRPGPTSPTATSKSSSLAASTSVCSNESPAATTTTTSKSPSPPTPARTQAPTTRRRSSWI